jgi:GNAT superfamily N-acetyltransferase
MIKIRESPSCAAGAPCGSATLATRQAERVSDTVHRMDSGGALVGAATERWEDEPSEIVEFAVAASVQGRGLGRRFVRWLLDAMGRRGKRGRGRDVEREHREHRVLPEVRVPDGAGAEGLLPV